MVRSAAKVCVLGADLKKNLFEEGEDPLGKTIRINRVPFLVLGVFKAKGESGGFGSRDDMICVPYTTAIKRLQRSGNTDSVQSIDVSAISSTKTKDAQNEITDLLRNLHRIEPGGIDDFSVRNMAEIAEGAADATNILTLLLGSIASISLLVGGIGIMNIMLVSVTERIREIGIRMSIGAKERDILLQFLAEAIVLSLLGGILGIGLGVGISPFSPPLRPSSPGVRSCWRLCFQGRWAFSSDSIRLGKHLSSTRSTPSGMNEVSRPRPSAIENRQKEKRI
jgi:putative ABC transport system permease protein